MHLSSPAQFGWLGPGSFMRVRRPFPQAVPLTALLLLACDTTARRPPGPGEAVLPPPATSAQVPAPEAAENPGFAGELVPPPNQPPGKPSGRSSIGRFAQQEHAAAQAIFERLRAAITRRSGKLHAVVLDLELGQAVVLHRPSEAVNPASNMKLLTAAAALDLLGPAYTFRTELFARIDEQGRAARLVVRGGGDPALTSSDLFRLAESAALQGLREVQELEVDQSLFDTPYVPPAFESQPGEWAAFRAPISALAVEANTVTLNVLPSRADAPARTWYEPPGVVLAEGVVATRPNGAGDRVAWTLDVSVDPMLPTSKLGGSIAEDLGRQRYTRRLEDPRRAPGLVLQHWLSLLGVKVTGHARVSSSAEARPARLTYVTSPPLGELLLPLGKDSDNFTAEMLLVALSSSLPEASDGKWSSARGGAALRKWLESGGIPLEGVTLKNGSGLFDANRVTAEVIALVLARMEARPEVFAEYLAQLSVYGTDGTLRNRMAKSEDRSRVRAKTGTLADVDAVSGYVLRTGGARPVVFSLVVTGARGGHAPVRQALDQAVFEWATALAQP